ncbi:MAG: Fic family protein [Acholeplasmatales bacterium]|nr:Fic family protein [Acholeplasmatales bacterium]
MSKISIRFYNDIIVRAVWNDEKNSWFFSVLDIVSAIRNEKDYNKTRNYWKYLKAKLNKEKNELVSDTTQLKIKAPDGKEYKTDVLDSNGIILLAKNFPSNQGAKFLEWFISVENSIDSKSKQKAYSLFDNNILDEIEVGTIKGLQQIHSYIFGGLYDFAGKIRTLTISKDGFNFANGDFLPKILKEIEKMSEKSFEEIIEKYVEMNIAHPFMEGNGRATRIWLDLILKKNLNKCIDWSKIEKKEYLEAMKESVLDSKRIKELLFNALVDGIKDREVFMKGIDYSYYYEEV